MITLQGGGFVGEGDGGGGALTMTDATVGGVMASTLIRSSSPALVAFRR